MQANDLAGHASFLLEEIDELIPILTSGDLEMVR